MFVDYFGTILGVICGGCGLCGRGFTGEKSTVRRSRLGCFCVRMKRMKKCYGGVLPYFSLSACDDGAAPATAVVKIIIISDDIYISIHLYFP